MICTFLGRHNFYTLYLKYMEGKRNRRFIDIYFCQTQLAHLDLEGLGLELNLTIADLRVRRSSPNSQAEWCVCLCSLLLLACRL